MWLMVPSVVTRQEVGRLVIKNERMPNRSQASNGFVGSGLEAKQAMSVIANMIPTGRDCASVLYYLEIASCIFLFKL
jgi:hypothetical protein